MAVLKKDIRHLMKVWRETVEYLESEDGHVLPEPDGEDGTDFWHRADVMDENGAVYPAWILVAHSGDDPGRPMDLVVQMDDGKWQVQRCMPDALWAKFGEAYRYGLKEPCPKDRHKSRQF